MPRTFADGSYLEATTAWVTVPPFSFSVWVRRTGAETMGMMAVGRSGSNDNRHGIFWDPGFNNVRVHSRVTSEVVATSTSPALDTWTHIGGVWASATSRKAYTNGIGGTVETTSMEPTALTRSWIGRYAGFTTNLEFIGQICEAAMWNIALSDADMVELASGLRAKWVQPGSLVSYVVIDGTSSPEPDFVGGQLWTVIGTPANYTTDAPPLFDAGAAVYDQVSYRWRQDNGSLLAP